MIDNSLTLFEFHISRKCRDKYDINESLFSLRGNIIISDFRTARYLAQQINQARVIEGRTDELVTAGHINGLGLLHEILHFLIRYYEEKENPGVFSRAINHLESKVSPEELNFILHDFIEKFPPLSVHKKVVSPAEYLQGVTGNKSNREIILEEIFLLNIENINPATRTLEELYSEKELSNITLYQRIIDESELYFRNERPLGSDNLPLFDFLKRPIITNPYSLEGQLDFIRENWAFYIFEIFNMRLLGGKDLIQEDMHLFYKAAGFEKPSPPVPAYEFDKNYFDALRNKLESGGELTSDESRFYYSEYEKFSFDIEWMPKVIMIAKNVYVWLNQLSKKYNREIKTLNKIPDEELQFLADSNFTALWLIGIWERSTASKKIKQIMGNPEAAASAYSLFDYVIASDIGGETAFEDLKFRAALKGIRLASDMVPNHTGIYSKWVVEKPDYFLSVSHPPYPSYSFNGPNLSDDQRVEVRIEDKYYNHTDAAVIFQRKDSFTGDLKYIYHGNDGTHMPWNDTAQLNLLNPEVREALIQTIMHVARKTPIIRFDAAMTLAKKHYQRLWFPQPGTGGAVPSRSDNSMTREQFDLAMPQEFWREVVDRMNAEMPETLLLAEAFWLMEGYFVRTLGMHRVYNSAFMHMMMKEENEKYRLLIKNTLEFNAEILKRYVNFMSNPDEETAVNQFGKGDKYFGVCVMMITLPGLPMFAHGQIEGFSEKYGMEYQKAYYDEHPDGHLIYRHMEEIFPLLKKRYLFSQVNNFEFYDYIDNFGNVNENVFAFSNMSDGEKAFVLYNNSYTETRGTIQHSFSKPYPGAGYNSKKLAAALQLNDEYRIYYKVYEHKSRLQYLISGKDISESGIFIPLYGYEYRVYLGFEQFYDHNGEYEKLYRYLDGRGVYSLEETMSELTLAPFHYAFSDLLNEESVKQFNQYLNSKNIKQPEENFNQKLSLTISELNNSGKIILDSEKVFSWVHKDFEKLKTLLMEINKHEKSSSQTKKNTKKLKSIYPEITSKDLYILFPQIVLYRIFESLSAKEGYDLFDRLLMNRVLFNNLARYMAPDEAGLNVHLIKILSSVKSNNLKEILKNSSARSKKSLKQFFETLMDDTEAQSFLNVNEYKKSRYFVKERLEYLLHWINLLNLIFIKPIPSGRTKSQKITDGKDIYSITAARNAGIVSKLQLISAELNYKIDEILKSFDVKEIRSDGTRKKVVRRVKKIK